MSPSEDATSGKAALYDANDSSRGTRALVHFRRLSQRLPFVEGIKDPWQTNRECTILGQNRQPDSHQARGSTASPEKSKNGYGGSYIRQIRPRILTPIEALKALYAITKSLLV